MHARLLAILVVFPPLLAPACQIPVFRYALERWIADNYELVLFHNGGLDEEHQQLLEEGILHCNLNPVPIDVSKPEDPALQVYGTADCSEVFEGSEMVIDKTLQPLEGAGALVIGKVPPAALGEAEKPVAQEPDKKPAAKFGSPLLTNMMWLVGVLLVALMGVTIFMKRSSVR